MANIEEVGKETKKKFEKIFDTIKEKFKEKPVFYTALIAVVIFALYKLFNSSGDQYAEEETVTNAYVPVGYDGYPYMSDSMLEDLESMYGSSSGITSGGTTSGGTTSSGTVNGESSSYVEDSYIFDTSYTENLEQYNKELLDQLTMMEDLLYTTEQNALANELTYTNEGEVYNALGELIYSNTQPYKVLLGGGTAAETQLALETANNLAWRNQQLQQMQANSAAWSKATTTAEKNALHEANQQIAKSLGLTYNSATGKWYEANGSEALIYSTGSSSGTTKTSTSTTKTTTSGSSSYGGVSYDKNTDYAALIQQAKASGASQSTIDTLTAQRNAKIAGENLNADGTKKTTSSSSSSSKSSSSSSKGETNRDSGKTYVQGTTKTSGTVNPTTTSSGGVSYDKNKDYAQAIKDAKAAGASQSTINKLQAQREAKIKGENLNADGTKK